MLKVFLMNNEMDDEVSDIRLALPSGRATKMPQVQKPVTFAFKNFYLNVFKK
jgi:hypothetical protein